MNDLEKAAIKALCKGLVDDILPKVIAAEEARLPLPYQPLAKVISDALLPQLQKALDEKIAAL